MSIADVAEDLGQALAAELGEGVVLDIVVDGESVRGVHRSNTWFGKLDRGESILDGPQLDPKTRGD